MEDAQKMTYKRGLREELAGAAGGSVEFDEVDGRGLVNIEAVGFREEAKNGVNVREMVGGHVTQKGAVNFIVAQAAMQPTDEQGELHQDGRCDG
jgi:hypothetical protein